jgi:hypothetical protein
MNPPENQEPTRILLVDDELPAIASAARQYQLITSERVLVEQTLHGSIHALIGALSLANPVAFGRASRIKARVRDLADAAGLTDLWRIEVAAMLSQIGLIALSPETVDKLATGEPLSQAERDTLDRMPEIIEQLLGQIPRLESMRAMIAFAAVPEPSGCDIPVRVWVVHRLRAGRIPGRRPRHWLAGISPPESRSNPHRPRRGARSGVLTGPRRAARPP